MTPHIDAIQERINDGGFVPYAEIEAAYQADERDVPGTRKEDADAWMADYQEWRTWWEQHPIDTSRELPEIADGEEVIDLDDDEGFRLEGQ